MVVLSFRSTTGWPEYWLQYGVQKNSDHKSACPFARLIRNLREARKLTDEKDVVAAKLEFGDRFAEEFSLVRAGKSKALKKPQDIARKYREKCRQPQWWDEIEFC